MALFLKILNVYLIANEQLIAKKALIKEVMF